MSQNEEKLIKVFLESVRGAEASSVQTLTTSFYGWDSLSNMALITALEDDFNVVLDVQDIARLRSYADAKNILTDRFKIEF